MRYFHKENSYETSELIKIGVDKDGNLINAETKKTYSNKVETAPLEGAVFGLFTDNTKIEGAIGKNAVQLKGYDVDAQGNPGSDSDTTFTVTPAGKKDPAMTGDVVSDGENVTATVDFPAAGANLVLKGRNGSIHKADLYVRDKYFGFVVEGDEKTTETSIYFVDPQNKLVSQRDTYSDAAERTFDLSKGTQITAADLKDDKVKSGVSMDAMMGLAEIYSAASEALPEEVSAMLALFSLNAKK